MSINYCFTGSRMAPFYFALDCFFLSSVNSPAKQVARKHWWSFFFDAP